MSQHCPATSWEGLKINMTSIQPPLSPSHLHNVVGASTFAVPSRKRIVFEEEDDFMSAALLAEAEMEDEQPPDDLPSSPPRASSSAATDAMGRVADASTITTNASATRPRQHLTSQETVVHSRPGVKEGKKRMVMELEDGFDEDALMEGECPGHMDMANPGLSHLPRSHSRHVCSKEQQRHVHARLYEALLGLEFSESQFEARRI